MSRRATAARGWLAAAALAAAPAAHAATLCTATASALAFGIYDTLLAAPTDTAGTVTVSCTPGVGDPLTTGYTLTIAGTGSGGDAVRSIAAGAYRLYFQTYKDAARTQVWGNGSATSGVVSNVVSVATGVPGLRVHTTYARMPPQQAVAPGLYTGTLLVTVDY